MALDERIKFLQASRHFCDGSDTKKQIENFVDPNSFFEIDALARNNENYTGVVAGFGKINGKGVYIFAQDIGTRKGVMSTSQISKICKVLDMAQSNGLPVVGFYNSCGGQLDDEFELMESFSVLMKKTSDLSGVVPQIAVISGTCLGVTALIASKADFIITMPNSEFDIETRNKEKEDYVKSGISHIGVDSDAQAFETVRTLVSILPQNNLSVAEFWDYSNNNNSAYLENVSQKLYDKDNDIDVKSFLSAVIDENSCIELQQTYGKGISLALAKVLGETVGIVFMRGGSIDSDSCAKTARFIRFCDAFTIPLVTFVNAEKFESLKDATKLSCAYCEATTPKISVIIGEAYGSVFCTTSIEGVTCDLSVAWVNSSICIINPETAAIIFESDKLKNLSDPVRERKEIIDKYIGRNTPPFKTAQKGFISDVIVAADTRDYVGRSLEMLRNKRVSQPPKKHNNIPI